MMSGPSPLCELFENPQNNKYPRLAEAIFDKLDNASFLAMRAVCHPMKAAADYYKRRWKEVMENASPTAIIDAARAGNHFFVQLMIDNGADVNAQMAANKETALHKASRVGHLDIVDLLLANGANIRSVSVPTGETALHMASLMGHVSVVKTLLAHGAEVNSFWWRMEEAELKEFVSWTEMSHSELFPLHMASFRGHLQIVKLLVEHGADVNCKVAPRNKQPPQKSPLDHALVNDHQEVVEFLLANGAEQK